MEKHERMNGKPLPPVGERAAAAAAYVFRSCNVTRTGVLLRWEFASVVEMMMRQKLVPYLIDQVDAARLDAEFVEASQGAEECVLETFERWFEKFDAYLLNFYPEVQSERPRGNARASRRYIGGGGSHNRTSRVDVERDDNKDSRGIIAYLLSRETLLGFLGVACTVCVFVLPRVRRAWKRARAEGRAFLAPWRWVTEPPTSPKTSSNANPAGACACSPLSLADGGTLMYGATGGDYTPTTSGAAGGRKSDGGRSSPRLTFAPDTAGSGNNNPDPSLSSPGRRELFGFRRRMRSLAQGAARGVSSILEEEPEDRHDWDGRRMSRHSIVANTEEMTQLALSAKNDELAAKNEEMALMQLEVRRHAAAKTELVAGMAEVLATLSRATAAQPEAVGGAAGADAAGTGGTATSGSHRALLSASRQAQAWLQSMQLTHDRGADGGGSRDAFSSLVHEMPGLAPSGMSYGMAATSLGGEEDGATLTWTSATGAQDVQARLYPHAD